MDSHRRTSLQQLFVETNFFDHIGSKMTMESADHELIPNFSQKSTSSGNRRVVDCLFLHFVEERVAKFPRHLSKHSGIASEAEFDEGGDGRGTAGSVAGKFVMDMACDYHGCDRGGGSGVEHECQEAIEAASRAAGMASGGMPAVLGPRATSGGHVCEARGEVRGADAAVDGIEALRGGVECADGHGVSQDSRSRVCKPAGDRGARLHLF